MAEPEEITASSESQHNEPLNAPDTISSGKVTLADLSAKGTMYYAHKNYEEAAEVFAKAAELQAELSGELHHDNGEILFLYGRAMFKVGQAKSDVLGGQGEKKTKAKGSAKPIEDEATKTTEDEDSKITKEGAANPTPRNGQPTKREVDFDAKQPLFHFTGDENFEDSDDEEEATEEEATEEVEDDLAVSFEVLDLARVLFTKKLERVAVEEQQNGQGKEVETSPMIKHIKERLADTHDLLAEISLENERFPGAVTDFRAALLHKQQLYPEEDEIVAEAHFKLSLALEFASISNPKDVEDAEEGNTDASTKERNSFVDQGLRCEAAKELEAALNSTKMKLQNKEVELATSHSPDDNDIMRAQIVDVKEIIADMENRLVELKGPEINLKEALYGQEIMGGVLQGFAPGESTSEATARIEEAKKGATDLTGLVKRKKPTKTEVPERVISDVNTNGKRKAGNDTIESSDAKKTKVSGETQPTMEDNNGNQNL